MRKLWFQTIYLLIIVSTCIAQRFKLKERLRISSPDNRNRGVVDASVEKSLVLPFWGRIDASVDLIATAPRTTISAPIFVDIFK